MTNLYFLISLISGIIIGSVIRLPSFFVITLPLISLLFLCFLCKKRNSYPFTVLLIIFFVCLGILWVRPYSVNKPAGFIGKQGKILIKITSIVQDRYLKNVLYADVKQIDGFPLRLKTKVNDFSRNAFRYRGTYLVEGKLTRRKFRKTYFYTLWIKNNSSVKELPLHFVDALFRGLHGKIISYSRKFLSHDGAQFLFAVFLGRRDLVEETMKSVFVSSGAAHLFAISGLHVGLISLVLFLALKIFRVKFRARLAISVIFIFLYTFLTGCRPSILRAFIMYFALASSFFLKRRVSPFNSLDLAGIVCLLLNPLWVFDVGFQLSFLSVFGILSGFKISGINIFKGNQVLVYVKGIFFSTLFVNILTMPLISFYFEKAHLLGIMSNFILIPFFTFILTVMLIFLGVYFLPYFPGFIGEVLSISVFLFIKIAYFFGNLSVSSVTFSMPPASIIVYYLILSLGSWLFVSLRKKRLSMYKVFKQACG